MLQDYVDSLFRVYLQDLDTCLLDELAPQLVRGAKLWYLELRKAEKDPAGDTDSTSYNYLARRVKYQIVAAIKLTVQETNLAYVNHQLDRSTNARPAVVRGTGQLRSPPLWELFVGHLFSLHRPSSFSFFRADRGVKGQLLRGISTV